MHIIQFLKENNSAINRLPLGFYALIVLQDSRQNDVVSTGPNRAVSVFETIEAIIWKPQIASIVPIVRITSKIF